ncbi:MAG: alpha/beta hydrolase [Pseudomonadota bacterium]
MQDWGDGTFKTSDGCVIEYTQYTAPDPDAPRVALIHSLALDRSFWNGVVAELKAHAKLLTYDCRGHGHSGREVAKFNVGLFARDLAELLDHAGWPDATIAGCSMGGCVAQAFAALYPERAAAICLIDTTAWYGADAPGQWRERAATARTKGMSALVQFQTTRWFGDAFRAAHPEIAQALIEVFLANDVPCYEATCEMLGTTDLRALLALLRMPVAIVVGAEDYATPVAMAEALHAAIPHSTLSVLPNARHLTPVERPGDIATAILNLARNDRSRAAAS